MLPSTDISLGLHAASAADSGAPYMALALGPAVAARVVVCPESQPRFGAFVGAAYRYMTYNKAEYYGRPWANEEEYPFHGESPGANPSPQPLDLTAEHALSRGERARS